MGLKPIKEEPLKWGEEKEDNSIWGQRRLSVWGELGNESAKAWDELTNKSKKEHAGSIWE